jgi:glycerol-3-phosphate acyltransferase PlsY
MGVMIEESWAIAILLAYLAGSVPFGVLIAKSKGVNIREEGSKNIGATNVGRVLGKKYGLICFLLDVLKGALPVFLFGLYAKHFGQDINEISTKAMLVWICVALAALLGHMYSPWLKFGGGKGVATTFGGMVAMWPLLTVPVLVAFVAWMITAKCSKIVSLASLVAALALFGDTVLKVMFESTIEHNGDGVLETPFEYRQDSAWRRTYAWFYFRNFNAQAMTSLGGMLLMLQRS